MVLILVLPGSLGDLDAPLVTASPESTKSLFANFFFPNKKGGAQKKWLKQKQQHGKSFANLFVPKSLRGSHDTGVNIAWSSTVMFYVTN